MAPKGWHEAKVRDLPGPNDRPVTKLGPFGSSLKKSDYIPSGYKVYGQQQVLAGDQHFGDYWIGESKFRELQACEVQPGDILLSTMGSFGSVLRLTTECSPGIINPRLLRLSIDPAIAAPEFLEVYLKSTLAERQFRRFAQGGTMPAVNGASIGGLRIPLPPLPEQRKIADILSTWDQAIETTEALLATARTQKRALMQSLLTGKRRFPEFEGQGWKEVRLGDLVEITTGKAKRDDLDEDGDKIVLDMGSVSRSGTIIPKKRTFTTEDVLSLGDLVMPKDDIGGGNIIGKVVLVSEEDAFVLGDHVYRLRIRSNRAVRPDFLRFAINGSEVNRWLRRKANGTAQLGLGRRDIEKQVVRLPPIQEQTRIANILSDAELREAEYEVQIANLCTEKKALMQQLLTGKRRVILK